MKAIVCLSQVFCSVQQPSSAARECECPKEPLHWLVPPLCLTVFGHAKGPHTKCLQGIFTLYASFPFGLTFIKQDDPLLYNFTKP